jgi:hypothetical protein
MSSYTVAYGDQLLHVENDVTHLKIHDATKDCLVYMLKDKSHLVHLHLVNCCEMKFAFLGEVLSQSVKTVCVEISFEHDRLDDIHTSHFQKYMEEFVRERKAIQGARPGMVINHSFACVQHGAFYVR